MGKNSNYLIADSSGLVSLLSRSDANHSRARMGLSALERTNSTIIIPSDVFSETINTLNKVISHSLAVDAATFLSTTEPFLIVNITDEVRQQAVKRFTHHPSASLSFTDWIVLTMADMFSTKEIFGFDKGMEKQGYTLLPK